jgi:hypothetical protein
MCLLASFRERGSVLPKWASDVQSVSLLWEKRGEILLCYFLAWRSNVFLNPVIKWIRCCSVGVINRKEHKWSRWLFYSPHSIILVVVLVQLSTKITARIIEGRCCYYNYLVFLDRSNEGWKPSYLFPLLVSLSFLYWDGAQNNKWYLVAGPICCIYFKSIISIVRSWKESLTN